MADKNAEFKFKLDGVEYEVGALTLDDAMVISREFGVTNFQNFDIHNVGYVCALTYLGFRNKHPFLGPDELRLRVGAVDITDLMQSIAQSLRDQVAAVEIAADPPKAAPKAAKKSKVKPEPEPVSGD